ncbi:hypothetical protein AVEN_142690-1 [Araneus ventricosus]|uniref:Uncharacterized protein n=1 Tax=Araneus ventricosus TaxID=182803 RepID=A0A4Y2EAC9_ARAVE|nr:hypothetical protein AVEN_142690-1 [Araneus ventricosus]
MLLPLRSSIVPPQLSFAPVTYGGVIGHGAARPLLASQPAYGWSHRTQVGYTALELLLDSDYGLGYVKLSSTKTSFQNFQTHIKKLRTKRFNTKYVFIVENF